MSKNLTMSISFKKSTTKTNLNHNNRKFTEKQKDKNNHINYDRSYLNQYLVSKDLKELYKNEFDPSLEKYNQNQKRADRKIDNYYEHVKNSKKTALQQEMIIQVGDKDYYQNGGDWRLGNYVLERWFEDFEERNPNLKVYNASIHNDEASPHLHLNFVPVASGYKLGLEKQVAFDKAIKQQDHTLDKNRPFADWREKEVALISEILKELGIERKIVGTNQYKDVNDYKVKKDLENEIEQLHKDLTMKKQELLAYTKDRSVKSSIGGMTFSEDMEEVEVPTEEKNIFGRIKMKTVKQPTGLLTIPKKDFKKITDFNKFSNEREKILLNLLDTDLLKENKQLKNENELLYSEIKEHKQKNRNLFNKNSNLSDDIEDLKKDKSVLKRQTVDLRSEISSVCKSTKEFLKEHTEDIEAFKSTFKFLVDKITDDLDQSDLSNSFKKEYEKENIIKRTRKMRR